MSLPHLPTSVDFHQDITLHIQEGHQWRCLLYTSMQVFQDALKQYAKRKDKNLRMLMKYAAMFHVEKILRPVSYTHLCRCLQWQAVL